MCFPECLYFFKVNGLENWTITSNDIPCPHTKAILCEVITHHINMHVSLLLSAIYKVILLLVSFCKFGFYN